MAEFKRGRYVSLHIIFMIVCIFLLSLTVTGEEKEEKKDKKEETRKIQSNEIGNERVLKQEVFEKLPKGRDFISLLPLLPGINHETLLDGISIDGASSAENRYYIDGVDTTTLFTGESGVRVNFDFIEEIHVQTGGISAQYTGSTGGVIHVKTRSGGNEFHGQVVVYFDGSALGHNPRPTLRLNPLNEDAAEYVTYPEDQWTRWEPGFGLGGYIIKDRLWFFGSFMPKFMTTTRNGDNWPVPGGTIFDGETHVSGSNTFTRKDTFYAGSLKLTGQVTDNLRLSVSGILDYSKWKGELPGRDRGYEKREYARYGYETPKFTIAASLDYTPHKNVMLNASFGYYWADHKQVSGPPDGPRYYFITSNVDVPGAVTIKPRGWANYSSYYGFRITKQVENRLTGAFDMTCHAKFAGEHVFKAGARMERIGIDKDEGFPYDDNRFYWGRDFWYYPNEATTLGYIEVREPFGVVAKLHNSRWALYVQDSWTIAGKLTLNLGARWETEDIPAFIEGEEPPIQFNFSDKFAPRLGFVYNVSDDSSLTIFGSFGIYYDVIKLDFAEDFYGGFKWISHFYDIVNPDWENAYPETDHPQTGGLAGGRYFQTIIQPSYYPDYNFTQPDIKPFQKKEFTLGIRKTFKETWTLSARYLHNYIVNAVEDVLLHSFEPVYVIANPGSDWLQESFDELITYEELPQGVKASRAVREYTSVTLSLDRKFKNNWLGGISYTWSRLYGNYAGLVSSEEPGTNRPNLSSYFNRWFSTYNQYGREELGILRTDRTHQFKLYGAYAFDFGLTLGFNAYALSGVPVQTELYLNGTNRFYPLGRGSEGRTPWLWQIDLYAEYNLKLSHALTLQFNVNITNLTDNDTARNRYMLYTGGYGIYLPYQQIIDGFDYLQVIADKGYVDLDPRYNMAYDYLDAIAARLGLKLIF